MAKWNYTIHGGKALREAIRNDELEQTAECLLKCLEELVNKLSDEDKDWKGFDIEDLAEEINSYLGSDDYTDEIIDEHLAEFYDICDDVMAWIEL